VERPKERGISYDPPLDPGIAAAVVALSAAGVETFESCEGGSGHAYPEPTVRFHGDRAEGLRALAVAMRAPAAMKTAGVIFRPRITRIRDAADYADGHR
jgi:hypothetical protein